MAHEHIVERQNAEANLLKRKPLTQGLRVALKLRFAAVGVAAGGPPVSGAIGQHVACNQVSGNASTQNPEFRPHWNRPPDYRGPCFSRRHAGAAAPSDGP